MNNNNGYLKAQREYDNQLPPSCDDKELSEDEEQSRREAYETWMERKADEAREERMMELGKNTKIGSNIDKYLDKRIEE